MFPRLLFFATIKRMTINQDFEVQLNFLFQTAAEGILLTDSDGYLRRLNPAAAAMLELTPNARDQHSLTLFKRQPELIRLLNAKGEQQAEVNLPHHRVATGVGVDRVDGGRIVLLHDITERHAIDSRRESLIRAVAHDFRNPLNGLLGYADLVAVYGPLNADQSKFLLRIRQTAQKLYDLAETLVDLAWVEAGMALEHKPIEIGGLIKDCVDDLVAEASQHDVTLVISLQHPIPTVIGDPRRIKQTVLYLLQNAIRYSYPDSNVAIHAWQDGPRVFCSVGDQGLGISEEDQHHIWDRLWRSSDERVRAIPGGGIGLTFARAIIERHGGQISIESELDKGTTVTFVLPLAEGW